jgi:PTS system galactitol-specific IIB component
LNKTVKVVIVCATGLATSTMAATKLTRELAKRGVDAKVTKGQIHDLESLVKNGKPDFVVATAVTKMDVGVPVFNGVPLLSNRGVDEFYKEVMDLIDTL